MRHEECKLYDDLVRWANAEGWHLFRCYDSEWGKAPADILGVAPNGLGVCMEVKVVDTFRRKDGAATPSWGAYLPHQISWAHRYAEADALVLLVEQHAESLETRVWLPWHPKHWEAEYKYVPFFIFSWGTKDVGIWNEILRYRSAYPPWIDPGQGTSHRRGPAANRA